MDLLAAVLDVDSTSVDTDLPELGEMVGVGGGGGAAAVLVAVVEGSLDLGGEAELQPPHSLFQQVPFAETKHRTRTGYLTIIIIVLRGSHCIVSLIRVFRIGKFA